MKYLQKDDLFMLEKGMVVYAMIPEKFVYTNRPFSDKLTTYNLEVDIIYTNEEVTRRNVKEEANHIANEIFKLFLNSGHSVTFKDCKDFTNTHINIEKKLSLSTFEFKGGMFKVTSTALDGGGMGHNDHYPDGWHVYAVRLINGVPSKEQKDIIHFYQSGSFTAVNKNIKPIKNT